MKMGGWTFQTKGHVFDSFTAWGRSQVVLYVVFWLWTAVICVQITKDNLTSESQGMVKIAGQSGPLLSTGN